MPKLAGQRAEYILKQLDDFRSGARRNEYMNVMAVDLSESDMADIAVYFASRERSIGVQVADIDRARSLFANGDPTRNIVACASCHGADGNGNISADAIYPALAGQHVPYLRKQLTDWQHRARTNSVDGIMNSISKSLTDSEIHELADYLYGLSTSR